MANGARARLVEDLDRLASDAGISHAALARAAGISDGYLAEIMRGDANPTLETYAKLAIPLGADLSVRLYPNTGPVIRDRHQARILEHLLEVRHPRWLAYSEVKVIRPARGWIDAVFRDPREALLLACEIESDVRRIEQTVRWSKEKADSLPSWPQFDADTVEGDRQRISQLIVIRRTKGNRDIAKTFARQLAIAFPAHPQDAIAALTGTSSWPGAALIWAEVDRSRVRLLPLR